VGCWPEIHYNEDRRVTASRDFGGERYGIELDEAGNMPGSACQTATDWSSNTTISPA